MKATYAASVFDGFAGGVVTAKREIFYRRRIFATFAGVFLRMGDTISPAKNALSRRPHYRRIGQVCAAAIAALERQYVQRKNLKTPAKKRSRPA
jgi:hypothetical protein